ncbi:3291_t:CDS:2 [Paraglomus brasilianum]|uniref:3291_t:CDS:1 n=1 Tax=Paraglomus brasilianum TaxID=144538 RepID=A0A9N8ZG08_9GLOM|nr:3291_t:CDS:2 [Paraglomus brasilianum]
MRKRKASKAFSGEFDYLYGIVSTGKLRSYGMALHNENIIVPLSDDILEDDTELRRHVKKSWK